jgi:hypothetical protein
MFVNGVDARSAKGRKYKQHYDKVTALLGDASPVQEDLVRRLAGLMIINEQFDADLIEGREVDTNQYLRSTNSFRGLVKELGLLPQQIAEGYGDTDTKFDDLVDYAAVNDLPGGRYDDDYDAVQSRVQVLKKAVTND